MMTDIKQPLTVYQASAGSGKTFQLATQYISLLILNPQSFRSILAVTFTNKATEEMKMRILSQLYGISHRLPDSQSYSEKVQQATGLEAPVVRTRAGLALDLLLHHFSEFRVETIDAFFQTVLKNLAHELDLTANLRIELNDQQVMEQAVDDLIEQLDEKSPVLHWILDYIHEKMEDDKSWNVIRQVKTFGKNIFQDAYKEHFSQLEPLMKEGNPFFSDFAALLRRIRKDAEDQLKTPAETFFKALEDHGFSADDLAGKKNGIWSYFSKLEKGQFVDEATLVNQTVRKCLDDPKNWVIKSKAMPGTELFDLVEDTLWPLLKTSEGHRPELVKAYKSADLTLRHLSPLKLLGKIGEQVHTENEEANRFLLSDTQNLLHSLIQNEDSPFIFEKIGARLEHIMIDEFQDTSRIQWKNFKVLLQETMSHEDPNPPDIAQNLIVGDIKQSIYRWRGGDWRLLGNIDTKEFSPRQIREEVLNVNYRSEKNIVTFNNAFFEEVCFPDTAPNSPDEEIPEDLKRAYAVQNLHQEVPAGKESRGIVRVQLLSGDDTYQETMMHKTVETIQELLAAGCRQRDIAILVRSNDTIQAIGAYFMENLPKVTLVSDLAFCLDASSAVNLLVDALRLIADPGDRLALASLVKNYRKGILEPDLEDNRIFLNGQPLEGQLPEAYIRHLDDLENIPLIDLVERLYTLFGVKKMKGQGAYVCAFYDQLQDWLQDNVPDIREFLRAWDDNLHVKSIQSDEADGIRLLTIHKSKGLEFDHIVLPFCDWRLEGRQTLWCTPGEAPYNRLPVVPADFSKKWMTGSVYEPFYQEEHAQNLVDNMNLLYVAFTRAKRNLFVLGKQADKSSCRGHIFGRVLPALAHQLDGSRWEEDETESRFEYGSLYTPEKHTADERTENVFLQPSTPLSIPIENFDSHVDFRQSNKSRAFVENEEETDARQEAYIQTGNVLHAVLSSIRTLDDVDGALRQLDQEGVLDGAHLQTGQLKTMMQQRVESPQVRDWFDKRWTLFNECTIVSVDPVTKEVVEHRPDRVMADGKDLIVVDFKFGKPRPEYEQQVREYMHLLTQMQPQTIHIRGFLWFVYPNRVTEVFSSIPSES